MYADIRGTRIYFDIDGPGTLDLKSRPVLFLLHGGPGGHSGGFKCPEFAFQDVAQLVYVDHRGCGLSEPGDEATYTLDNNIDDLDALRAHLGLDRISVLGYSYGGMVAQGYAIRYPQHVANLILLATAPSYRFLAQAQQWIRERGTPDQQRVCQLLWDAAFETDAQAREYFRLLGPCYSTTFDPSTFDDGWKPGMINLRALNRGFGDFLRTYDWTPQLPSIACPTLVLGGAHDWICPISQSRTMARLIPRAHLKVFPHSGHAIPKDETAAFQAAVRGFLTHPAS